MGYHSDILIEREQRHAQAIGALVKAGAVSRCNGHEEIYMDNGDSEAIKLAYAIGTNWAKEGRVSGNRREFLDAIKNAYEEAGDECPVCQKNF